MSESVKVDLKALCNGLEYDFDFIIEAINEKVEREDPIPLTEDQIRGMVGKPVWVKWMKVTKENYALCKVVDCIQKGFIDFTDQFCIKIKDIGEYYNIFAHEPKRD